MRLLPPLEGPLPIPVALFSCLVLVQCIIDTKSHLWYHNDIMTKRFPLRLPPELDRKVRNMAERQERSINGQIVYLLAVAVEHERDGWGQSGMDKQHDKTTNR